MSSISTRLGKKTIELSDICKCYDDRRCIDDFNYIFLRDDRIGIVGPNGCGKSTLMKIITGKVLPDSGSVEIGETVRIGYFMQENEPLDESMTVLEFVRSIGEYVNTVDGKATASQMCEKFLFGPKQQWTPIRKLSGGEKRRLYLLSVLMSSPNVLILDEPTNDLDIETLEILEDYIDGFAGIVIAVSHDRYFLDRVADRIFAFEGEGRLTQYEGGYSDYKEKSEAGAVKLSGATNGKIKEKYEADTFKSTGVTGGKSVVNEQLTLVSGQCSDTKDALQEKRGGGKPAYAKDRSNQVRFTYAERREYETIDTDIEKLESEVAKLDADIAASATQYSKLNELMQKKEELEAELEYKMERWVYLNDLAERIAGN